MVFQYTAMHHCTRHLTVISFLMPQVSAFLLQTLSLSGYIPVLSIWCIIKVIGLIRKNVECGRIAGPFPSPPLTNFRCSPLGAVPKKSGGIRIINDLSWPVKKSINEFVSPNDFLLSYTSGDVAVRRIQLFDDPYISKQDIASAFTHIIVHLSNRNLHGFKWHIQYYFSMCLVFGCRSSPFYITNLQMHLNLWLRVEVVAIYLTTT